MYLKTTNIIDELEKMTNWLGESYHFPAINVCRDESGTHIEALLPGIVREDLKIDLNQRSVTIHGERKEPEGKVVQRLEGYYGKFERTIEISHPIDENSILAELKNGVLSLTLPVAEEAKPRSIEVKELKE